MCTGCGLEGAHPDLGIFIKVLNCRQSFIFIFIRTNFIRFVQLIASATRITRRDLLVLPRMETGGSSQSSGRITVPRNSRPVLPRMEARGLSQFSRRERRELGIIQPRKFFTSEVLMSKINLYQQWEPTTLGRDFSLNNVKFNHTGDRFFCSFGESSIQLVGWEDDTIKATYGSGLGPLGVICDFQIMPSTGDSELVICGENGQVNHGVVGDAGMTTRSIGSHDGVATKLAVGPQSRHIFYSCGLDGDVHHYDLRANGFRKLFTCAQYSQVHNDISGRPSGHEYCPTIAVNPVESNYFSVGGYDRVARVYDIRMCRDYNPDEQQRVCVGTYSPPTPHYTHTLLPDDTDIIVRSLVYSRKGELLVSYGGDDGGEQRICLFPKASGFGHWFSPSMDAAVPPDVLNGYEPPNEPLIDMLESMDPLVYSGHRGIWGIRAANFLGPEDEYVMCGSPCGFLYIWDKKGTELVKQIPGDTDCVYMVEPHPLEMAFVSFGYDGIINMWASGLDGLTLPDNSEAIEEWKEAEAAREEALAARERDILRLGMSGVNLESSTFESLDKWIMRGANT